MRQLSGRAGIFLPYRDAIFRHKVALACYIVMRYIGLGRLQWRRGRDCDKDQLASDEHRDAFVAATRNSRLIRLLPHLRSEIVSQPRFGVSAAVLDTGNPQGTLARSGPRFLSAAHRSRFCALTLSIFDLYDALFSIARHPFSDMTLA